MFATPVLVALGVSLLMGFGGGWTLSDWRNGAEIERLSARAAVADAANERCANDVSSVKAGVKVITDAVAEREKAASDAMRGAELLAAKHKVRQAQITALPPVAPENQCEAIIKEQIEYVSQRGANGS